ncbi:Acyltransferase protein [Spatholobus suberectus]|nr:Acyltransferase protein [Spatholobus suberectus]
MSHRSESYYSDFHFVNHCNPHSFVTFPQSSFLIHLFLSSKAFHIRIPRRHGGHRSLSLSAALFRREPPSPGAKPNSHQIPIKTPRFAVSMDRAPPATAEVKPGEGSGAVEKEKRWEEKEKQRRSGWKEYLEQSKELIEPDGGPPRWFSPLECTSRLDNSPLLLFLPGIDGVGLGLILHHQKLGRIFDIWCLHIPIADRTPFTDLVKIVERTVRSEYQRTPNRPIYLVGESLGACLALAVAALNPDIDLVLILANPATSFSRSNLQFLTPLLEALPDPFSPGLPNILSSTTGESLRMALDNVVQGLPLQNPAGELVKDFTIFSLSLPVLADILPKETLLWKLKMLKSASAYAHSRLYAIKAQTLILCSGNDQLLPSQQEGERLLKLLSKSKCELRKFDDSGHFLFLEDNIDLVTIIKGTSYYRRGKYHDYASDFIPPTPDEAKKVIESNSLFNLVTSAVMLSTLEDGTIVKGLAGIPSEGPVLFVGYHMLLGIEKIPLISRIFLERNILVRGIAHPLMFVRSKTGKMPDISSYDKFRILGAVPVAPTNLFKLFSSKSHVLLYPGGIREALHRKGEEYKLFWPEQPEFVRMAARFGAKIVPFGAVGEDDLGQVVFDYDDLMKIPYFRSEIESLTNEATQLRSDVGGEVANQQMHLPLILPKVPGRFYYYFGKPLETEGMKQELTDRKKSHELYLQVKSEVERCIAYLKVKRESDPYRGIGPRLLYQATHATAAAKREEGSGAVEKEKQRRSGWNEYLEQSKELIEPDGGPPRWFSLLEGASRLDNSPLLLFLPGIDGMGLGLVLHHQKLARIFDIWCLHIPVADRTPFIDLVKIVERTVRLEYQRSPNRPIYLVGESLGACLALVVAALNSDIDLVLILANPATSFSRSNLQHLIPLLEALPDPLSTGLPNILRMTPGESLRMVLDNVVQGLPLQNTAGELVKDFTTVSLSLPVLADILPKETLLWKLKMLKSASAYAHSRLYAIKAQTLILCSGNDQLLPSQQEGERLLKLLTKSKCELRKFDDSGHFLFLEGNIDLLTIIKGTSYYRRGKYHDYASDFIPPTPDEAKQIIESYSLFNLVTSAVMLSTLEDGTIVKGLAGIPSEGPVLFVGHHMLLGLEKFHLWCRIFSERNIVVRGIAHPLFFMRSKKGKLPDISYFDNFRIVGAVPVAPTNLFKLFSSKSHVLLYPGGIREAFHRKGEEYKLFWPEQSEFVRMAARFGAKIVPFGAVGEDDLGQVVFDYDDLVKIPYFRSEIESLTNETTQLRSDAGGEVANQPMHLPLILPKVPGRLYYYFGKPLETEGKKEELRDKQKSHEFYLQVKSEVERCIAYLKVKRESDPYRGIGPRLLYQATHGFESEVPTFEI